LLRITGNKELFKEQAKREERNAARRAELLRMKEQAIAELLGNAQDNTEEGDELTKAANAADRFIPWLAALLVLLSAATGAGSLRHVDLVHTGKLEEAEAAARDLIERYPEVHDGRDRLGMMYEAKGKAKTAADSIARHSRSFASARDSTTQSSRPPSSSSSISSILQHRPNTTADRSALDHRGRRDIGHHKPFPKSMGDDPHVNSRCGRHLTRR
jgi:hypothetical protein